MTLAPTVPDLLPPPRLRRVSPTRLHHLARELGARTDLWRPQVRFAQESRWSVRVAVTDDYEAWLLTWLPGQGTDWHDHGGSGGAFVVLQGALVEGTAVHGVVRGTRHIHRRGVAHAFGPDYVHRVTNEGPDPAVSLHVYAPRLEVQHDYVSDDGILRRIATRREGDDW